MNCSEQISYAGTAIMGAAIEAGMGALASVIISSPAGAAGGAIYGLIRSVTESVYEVIVIREPYPNIAGQVIRRIAILFASIYVGTLSLADLGWKLSNTEIALLVAGDLFVNIALTGTIAFIAIAIIYQTAPSRFNHQQERGAEII